MEGLAEHAAGALAQQIDHMIDLTCALNLISDEAVEAIEPDQAPLAAGLRAIVNVVIDQAELMQRELTKMRADPQWNRTAGPVPETTSPA